MNAMDDIHKKVLKKFHTLCGVCGMTNDEKAALVASYGVESSADIDTHDLIDLCAKLQKEAGQADMNRLRKRAMAAIGGWLRLTGQHENSALIQGIACRATGYEKFNQIPAERLRNLYSCFTNKQKDYKAVDGIANDILQAAIAGSAAIAFGEA